MGWASLAALALALWLAPSSAPADEHRAVLAGLTLDLSVTRVDGAASPLVEGEAARIRLRVTDATGSPVARLDPAAWMDRLPATGIAGSPAAAAVAATCKDRVEAFLSGSLLSRPEVDLNVYYVLTLNSDATLSVVDPLFGFGGSRLLAMVFLEKPGHDWVLSQDGRTLWVSLPDAGKVAVVDTSTWKVVQSLEAGKRPERLVLQPDGRYLWVADAAAAGVTVIDTERRAVVARISTGAGPHDLAFSDDHRWAWVANAGAGTVSAIDVSTLSRVKDLATGREPVSLAWSAKAQTLWIAHRGDGSIVAVDGSQQIVARIAADPGLAHLRITPDGRLALVVNPEKDLIQVIDTASRRLLQTGDLEDGPERISFSDELAYVRHRGSAIVLMIPWKELGREGAPVPVVDFPGGQNPPGAGASTPADGIVQAPGSTAVLVANPKDDAVYYYKEGMAAPMGQFKGGRTPRAVLALDRSLREVEPGVYETLAQLGRAGRYNLALFANTPRLVHCAGFDVAASPATRAATSVRIEPVDAPREVHAGKAQPLRFRLTDGATGRAVTGAGPTAYTFMAPGTRQSRQEMREVEPGLYEATFRAIEPGVWYVFLESDALGEGVQEPALMLEAVP